MKYNFLRMVKLYIVFVVGFFIFLAIFGFLSMQFWEVHNENWDNINNRVDHDIIMKNFDEQDRILSQEWFIVDCAGYYVLIGIPLCLISGIQLKRATTDLKREPDAVDRDR